MGLGKTLQAKILHSIDAPSPLFTAPASLSPLVSFLRGHSLNALLQILSFLAYLKVERGEVGPHLVIAPLSVMSAWVSETKRWTPCMTAVGFHGPASERERMRKESLRPGEFDICVTTSVFFSLFFVSIVTDPLIFLATRCCSQNPPFFLGDFIGLTLFWTRHNG